MGTSRWSASDWDSYASSTKTKTTDAIFKSHSLKDDLNPLNIGVRESRDSDLNPQSNAIIVGLDVTGSMGIIADNLAREGLGTLVEEILARKPVQDPHIMFMGVGDAYYDTAPLQVTQFEADITIAKTLEDLYLEHGGGGNSFESYNLPWYFAANHTSIDCFEKRGKKGYLFTVGDEEAPKELLASHVKKIIGDTPQQDYTTEQLLTMVSRMYHVFHVVVEEGNHAKYHLNEVMNSWTKLLGQRVLRLSNYKNLSEVIVSAIQITEGSDIDTVTKSWSGKTSLVVGKAVNGLTKRDASSGELVRF
jgi:hypothetical protein